MNRIPTHLLAGSIPCRLHKDFAQFKRNHSMSRNWVASRPPCQTVSGFPTCWIRMRSFLLFWKQIVLPRTTFYVTAGSNNFISAMSGILIQRFTSSANRPQCAYLRLVFPRVGFIWNPSFFFEAPIALADYILRYSRWIRAWADSFSGVVSSPWILVVIIDR